MQLEIQLDDDAVQKLAYIQEQTNQDLSAAIKQAIDKAIFALSSQSS